LGEGRGGRSATFMELLLLTGWVTYAGAGGFSPWEGKGGRGTSRQRERRGHVSGLWGVGGEDGRRRKRVEDFRKRESPARGIGRGRGVYNTVCVGKGQRVCEKVFTGTPKRREGSGGRKQSPDVGRRGRDLGDVITSPVRRQERAGIIGST